MNRRLLLALTLALPACSVRDRPETRYHGQITPTASSPRCTPSKASASIRDGEVIFAPDEGTWMLQGKAAPDGTLTATHSRPTPDHKSFDTKLAAQWTPTTLRGTYTTPFCTYRVDLAAN